MSKNPLISILDKMDVEIPLFQILSNFPKPHPKNDLDLLLGISTIHLIVLTLLTPITPGWKLFRSGIIAPICCSIFGYLIISQIEKDDMTHHGVCVLLSIFSFRVLEYLVFFPPEENCHRIVPKSRVHPRSSNLINGELQIQNNSDDDILIPEPIPPPFTLSKYYWAWSLWWSYRGIGWIYQCPLPSSSLSFPFSRESSRISFFIKTIKSWLVGYIIDDFFRAIRNIYAADFFSGQRAYNSLNQFERGLYSTAVVIRVWSGLNNSWVLFALIFVSIGGITGWKGELWEPYGWPPMFGPITHLWRYPGLSTMWSTTWHGYNRRWLYVLGWIGIGENLLGLTHTGISSHPTIPEQTLKSRKSHDLSNGDFKNSLDSDSRNSTNPSGQISPSHPIPSCPSTIKLPIRKMSNKLMNQNLIKSIITFGLSGINHDFGTLGLLIKNHPQDKPIYLSNLFRLTPFFIIQPFALAFEALIKLKWRSWKLKHFPKYNVTHSPNENEKSKDKENYHEPPWVIFLERLIGFTWTWVWLGYTARFFVEGMTQLGAYTRGNGRDDYFSFFGGLIWGKWYI